MLHTCAVTLSLCRLKDLNAKAPEELKAFCECMDYYRWNPLLCCFVDLISHCVLTDNLLLDVQQRL